MKHRYSCSTVSHCPFFSLFPQAGSLFADNKRCWQWLDCSSFSSSSSSPFVIQSPIDSSFFSQPGFCWRWESGLPPDNYSRKNGRLQDYSAPYCSLLCSILPHRQLQHTATSRCRFPGPSQVVTISAGSLFPGGGMILPVTLPGQFYKACLTTPCCMPTTPRSGPCFISSNRIHSLQSSCSLQTAFFQGAGIFPIQDGSRKRSKKRCCLQSVLSHHIFQPACQRNFSLWPMKQSGNWCPAWNNNPNISPADGRPRSLQGFSQPLRVDTSTTPQISPATATTLDNP